MKPYIDILILDLVVVWIVDLSGFTASWMGAVSRFIGKPVRPIKPFACSLCMSWWTGIVYAIATGCLSIPVVGYCALLAYLSFPISQLLIFIHETLLKWMQRKS